MVEPSKPLSALPSSGARIAAFIAIITGGIFGAVIGYTLVRLQCDGSCDSERGIGIFLGALICAIGMSIGAVLVLRAVGEWRQLDLSDRRPQ